MVLMFLLVMMTILLASFQEQFDLGLPLRFSICFCSESLLFLIFLWVMMTILLASFQEQFDLGILLRFPIRFGSYYLLYIVFGLADPATILGGLCSLGFLADRKSV